MWNATLIPSQNKPQLAKVSVLLATSHHAFTRPMPEKQTGISSASVSYWNGGNFDSGSGAKPSAIGCEIWYTVYTHIIFFYSMYN